MYILFSVIYYLFLLVFSPIYFLLMFIVFLLTCLFDRKRVVIHKLSIVYAYALFRPVPYWTYDIVGLENFDTSKNCIVVANHQSMLDIPVLYVLPGNFKWVSKKEVYKMPFFGWALWMNGDVAIERGATRSAKKMIADCVRYLKMGIRVNIFPEGTRSKTGQLGKFKDGAFTIAKEAGVEIQPVVINGTRSITANGKWWIVPNKFSIRVLPRISRETVMSMDVESLKNMCRDQIEAEHRKLRPDLYA
jgi:1-acyl-sn-glycerol-3-phosphate acyltransferase